MPDLMRGEEMIPPTWGGTFRKLVRVERKSKEVGADTRQHRSCLPSAPRKRGGGKDVQKNWTVGARPKRTDMCARGMTALAAVPTKKATRHILYLRMLNHGFCTFRQLGLEKGRNKPRE